MLKTRNLHPPPKFLVGDKKPKTHKPVPTESGCCSFALWALRSGFDQKGITLLLVIVLVSSILSISIGIFNVVFGGLRVSGEVGDSFRALYAADQGIERSLYLDRKVRSLSGLIQGREVPVQSEACYIVRVSKSGEATDIVIAGQYRCGSNPSRAVRRGFQVSY